MANIVFDCSKFRIVSSDLHVRHRTYSGGRSLGGFRQVRQISNGYWAGRVSISPLEKWDMIDFRGFLTSLQGSANTMTMCLCDPSNVDFAGLTYDEALDRAGFDTTSLVQNAGQYGDIYTDGTRFSDNTIFGIPAFDANAYAVTANVNAGSVVVPTGNLFPYVRRGMRFSYNEYLYEVVSVVAGGVAIQPALRTAIPAGTVLDFVNPKIRVRLASDESGVQPIVFGRRMSGIVLDVEEDSEVRGATTLEDSVVGNWILASGSWDDLGVWIDTETWNG